MAEAGPGDGLIAELYVQAERTAARLVGRDRAEDIASETLIRALSRWSRISNGTQGEMQGQSGFGYPLVSVASGSSWWVLGWGPAGATTQVSANTGANWTQATAPIPTGVPIALEAHDATHALLTVENVTPNGATTDLLATANAGRSWNPVTLPG